MAIILLLAFGIPVLTFGAINAVIDGQQIFFYQKRLGKNGVTFNIQKLRTMKDGVITPFGKFLRRWAIDEIPQLWNVIRGEMSFVGPRPLLLEYREFYSDEQNRRHEVSPGITGLSQVNGRNALEWDRRFELDVHYVNHQSFLLDIKILIKTMIQLANKKSSDHHSGSLPKFSEYFN